MNRNYLEEQNNTCISPKYLVSQSARAQHCATDSIHPSNSGFTRSQKQLSLSRTHLWKEKRRGEEEEKEKKIGKGIRHRVSIDFRHASNWLTRVKIPWLLEGLTDRCLTLLTAYLHLHQLISTILSLISAAPPTEASHITCMYLGYGSPPHYQT